MRKAHPVRTLSLALALTLAAVTGARAQAPTPPPPAPAAADPVVPPPPGAPGPAVDPFPAAQATTTTTTTVETTSEPRVLVVEPAAAPHVLLSAKVGGIVPFDGLSPFVTVGLEVGYVLPVADHRLAIVLDVDYTQPSKTGSESDPRVTGGMYSWKLTEHELGIMPALLFRLTHVSSVVPYVGIGPRILLARSVVRDDGGTPTIMETREQSTRVGVGVPIGLELPVGPGRVIGELLLQYGTLNHVATGDANTGAASLSIGFRMLL